MTANLDALRGKRLLVLNWRDIRHSQAGGAESYMHEIARRWTAAGVRVTWFTAREPGAPAREIIDGIETHRAGGPLCVYAHTAVRLLATGARFDAVLDCQNGIPFFAPLFLPRRSPVVQVIHHVHHDQFTTRFSPAVAAFGRFLEGTVAQKAYARQTLSAVSPSTRQEIRSRLKIRTPIFVVPNGAKPPAVTGGRRGADPRLVVVSRLVPHKRIDLLLNQLASVVTEIPRLRVDIVGDGPELLRLQRQAVVLGLSGTVVFHGYQPDHVRDELLARAWLTASVSAAEGWGCAVIEAAGLGVPCLGLRVPGIRDSVLEGKTGWLVESERDFGAALVTAVQQLSDKSESDRIAGHCREWAACFTWERSAELLAGVVRTEIATVRRRQQRRRARSDIAAVVSFPSTENPVRQESLRCTDQITHHNGQTSLLLVGCDEMGAQGVLARLGIRDARIRLATRHDLLAGPAVRTLAAPAKVQT
ncbi:glycosyltransferase family 4 protein [Amycolatopsis sp. GM8]|uniref:glycosyltransferase family 4 protein n=1 Tax=Amycolatopsis sp. GM8 TaxID=2896530 RepID=UPI001F32B4D8|nr:glycosyltransferase family 4 protein [Amycolatopsis sp. GM8]